MPLVAGLSQPVVPLYSRGFFKGSRVKFRLLARLWGVLSVRSSQNRCNCHENCFFANSSVRYGRRYQNQLKTTHMKAILTLVAAATVLTLASCSHPKKEECSSCSAPMVSSKSPSKVTKHKH